MIRVKLSTEHPHWPLVRQTPGGAGRWGGYEFLVNQPVAECDYWVVCDGLPRPDTVRCPRAHTLLVTWEPPTVRQYSPGFLQQFAAVLTCQRGLIHPRIIYSQQAHPWFVGKSYDELCAPPPPAKTRDLSVVVSSKELTPGHRQRLALVRALREAFGTRLDLFGQGIRPVEDKWEALAPYRYSVALENLAYPDWVTEKLPDCLLAHTFPFYWGAPNVGDYFPPDVLVRLDLENVDDSIRRIAGVLADQDHYELHRPLIAKARATYLDQLQLFPLLCRTLSALQEPSSPRELIRLRPEARPPPSLAHRVRSKIRRLLGAPR